MLRGLRPIIDGDLIIYRCGFAAKDDEPLAFVLHSVKQTMISILDPFERREEGALYIDGPGNYRESVATIQPYKGNRDPSKVPKYKDEIKQYLKDYWNARTVNRMETDDALGIIQSRSDDTCIVSIDKDLDMIAGSHYNWVKKEYYNVDQGTANRWFWRQVLTGDTTDNIRGIPKVGPKTADALLSKTDGSWVQMHNAVRKMYEEKGIGNEFHENATLLWIQRQPWINYDGSRLDGNSQEESSEEGKGEDAAV